MSVALNEVNNLVAIIAGFMSLTIFVLTAMILGKVKHGCHMRSVHTGLTIIMGLSALIFSTTITFMVSGGHDSTYSQCVEGILFLRPRIYQDRLYDPVEIGPYLCAHEKLLHAEQCVRTCFVG